MLEVAPLVLEVALAVLEVAPAVLEGAPGANPCLADDSAALSA